MLFENSEYSLLVLGIAGGAGYVYHGHCSSSFLVLKNNDPLFVVDLGAGVTRTLHSYGYDIPDTIIVTHNHTDHAGELPVVVRVEEAKGRRLNIVSASPVSERLLHYRMAEHNDLYPADTLAEWHAVVPDQTSSLTDELDITFLETRHSEVCYGFVISRKQDNFPLLGYTADSGYYPSLYDNILGCSVSIYDARPSGNQWHASIDELTPYLKRNSFIIGHGIYEAVDLNEHMLQPGQRILIGEGGSDEVC